MKITTTLWNLGLCAVPVIAALAQPPAGARSGPPPFDPVAVRAAMAAYEKVPDTTGTGPYPAVKEMIPSLPNHVVYHPKDLAALGRAKLGVVVWGNGGCSADGASSRLHLEELASHGYLAIAGGTVLTGPGSPPHAEPPLPTPGAPPVIPPAATLSENLLQSIDWALAENERQGSPFHHRINPAWIAVSGWSCGGVQALRVAADPRVRAVVIHDSGLFPDGTSPGREMDLDKAALKKLHTPIIYLLGGTRDIAYANGMDDFKRIDTPKFVGNLDVGHGGTFMEPNGGRMASVAVSWLDWQLKGDPNAAKRFVGPECGLCRDPAWTIDRKGL